MVLHKKHKKSIKNKHIKTLFCIGKKMFKSIEKNKRQLLKRKLLIFKFNRKLFSVLFTEHIFLGIYQPSCVFYAYR